MKTTIPPKSPTASLSTEQITSWFEQFISDIKVDHLQIELGVADAGKSEFYQNAMAGNYEEVFKKIRFEASQLLIEKLVKSFLFELSNMQAIPEKLAFSLTPATILVWAEINDNDVRAEDGILLTEAKVNAYARQYDFSFDTMIVEKSDCIPLPAHYTQVSTQSTPTKK